MPMPLDQWDIMVRPHLMLIEAGAQMCMSHCEQLPIRPYFATKAEDDMRRCEAALAAALEKIRTARAIYGDKGVET
jgi:hypothetical protein